MIKKLVLVFIALFAIQSYAQEGTQSPYSFYGIGSLKFKGTVENRSMGGLSVYKDSVHINLRNPASYAGKNLGLIPYNGENRPVTFTVGGSHTSTNLESNSGESKVKTSTFDYLALSIPVGRFGFGVGLMPFTSVGYKLENNRADGQMDTRFQGKGGLNKAFLGAGYQITDGLSVGVDASYNFGSIENSTVLFRYNDEGELLQSQSRESNRSELSGLNFNFGLHYQTMISDKLELQSSFTYTPSANLTSNNERTFASIILGNDGNEYSVNTLDADLEGSGLLETELKLPTKLTFGAGLGEPRKWFAGVEYEFQKTSDFSNPLYTYENSSGTETVRFENASRVSLGGFFIPDYNSFSSYWNRVVYRAGVRFENTGLNVSDQSIKEFGISFGVGVPVGNLFSNANLGFEIGQRGTTDANLIQENFVNFNLSLSLNDRWFVKNKYD
ncbi:hypothetical protein ES677_09085 [Bizionia gelidisalsuginis]|uniref:Long-subunit fatty acid transport protein n=2 Tax=Bizionia TaxID=283785 RepID=A0A8H2LGQ7_9FLAO|nr:MULTISPECIES: hypothetical protein [Bizionia]TYB78103.1 hypothetical protein ES676_02505 [Bizionia saleffrena]TYC12119.1 hypothetical protein ES677_09085 [Bizionia gelidisalsuginis]